MNETWPTVSVIIPARPGQDQIRALQASLQLDYPADRLEIIVARGKQPSGQRNTAIKSAKGDLIYFLDDDSVAAPGNLRQAVALFGRPEVAMVGGPNVCPEDAPFLEKVFALVLSSWLAFGPSRARYSPVGKLRDSSEKELILCNLVARRPLLVELGGFNEALYPNEENAVMDELQKRGHRLLYDPDLVVHRRPRSTLRAFARMLLTYGRGRAEQFRLHPTPGSFLNFAPPLFCVYLLSILFTNWIGLWALAPLCFYMLALAAQCVAFATRAPLVRSLCATPLVFLTHVLYGLGFWRGILTPLRHSGTLRNPVPVTLERIPVG